MRGTAAVGQGECRSVSAPARSAMFILAPAVEMAAREHQEHRDKRFGWLCPGFRFHPPAATAVLPNSFSLRSLRAFAAIHCSS